MNMWIQLLALCLLFTVSGCGALPGGGGSATQTPERVPGIEAVAPEASDLQAEHPEQSETDPAEQEETGMTISVRAEQYEIVYELNDSTAARQLYGQLPLTVEVEPFSDNEMTFYPERLDVGDTPLSGGAPGSLSYYEPWGDVVMFYAPCAPNGSLYELGTAVSGAEHIEDLSGTITVSAVA